MRIEYGEWKLARTAVILEIEKSTWPRGLSTDLANQKMLQDVGAPPDPLLMWDRAWRTRNIGILAFFLYYFMQSGLKNRYFPYQGMASGVRQRVRSIYNVEQGSAAGELDDDGEPMKGEKKGHWMYWKDLLHPDAEAALVVYIKSGTKQTPTRRFLERTVVVLSGHPEGTRAGDVADEIFRGL